LSYTRADADGPFLLGFASAKGNRRKATLTRAARSPFSALAFGIHLSEFNSVEVGSA